MFRPHVGRAELRGWINLSGDDPERPFEDTVGRACKLFSYCDYTALFLPETIRQACAWSARKNSRPFAMFFTIPDPAEYFVDTTSFGGLVATGADAADGIECFLTQDDYAGRSLSPYA